MDDVLPDCIEDDSDVSLQVFKIDPAQTTGLGTYTVQENTFFFDVADEAAHSVFSGMEFSSAGCRNDQTNEMCQMYVGSFLGLWPLRGAERK
jgi:hypothetical protein